MRNSLIVSLMLLSCCQMHEQQSSIVKTAETAGAGSLEGVSTAAIGQWFALHKDVAHRIDDMCRPLRRNAPAQWADSTEGRVCEAAAQIAASRLPTITGDSRTFSPVPDARTRKHRDANSDVRH